MPSKKNKTRGVSPVVKTILKHVFVGGLGFAAAGVVFLIIMDTIVMPMYQRSGAEITAPDLRGVTVEEARRLTGDMNLPLVIDEREYNNEYPENTIALQIPQPNTLIKPGRRMHVVVSDGPQPFTVPDVIGKSVRNARLAVQEAGLTVGVEGERWVPSNEYPYGIVAGQDPEAESEVARTEQVTLFVSNGRPETDILMPNLIHLSLSAALDTLQTLNFHSQRISVQYEDNEQWLPDTIIEQYPDPGQPTNRLAEIDLVVAYPGGEEGAAE